MPMDGGRARRERVAVVGSRRWSDWRAVEAMVRAYVRGLHDDTILVSGGAGGVDTWAREAGSRLVVIEVRPAWWRGRKAGPERNAVIVELADRVVAFWDGASPGTASTIELARRAGKPIEIIRPEAGPERNAEAWRIDR